MEHLQSYDEALSNLPVSVLREKIKAVTCPDRINECISPSAPPTLIQKFISLHPDSPGSHLAFRYNAVAMDYLGEGNLELAKMFAVFSIKLGLSQAHVTMGILFEHEDRIPNAIRQYETAISKGLFSARNNLGSLYFSNGDLDRAKELFLISSEEGEAYASEADFQLGILFNNTGRNDKSEEHLKKSCDAGHPEAAQLLGIYYIDNQNPDEAEKYLRMAIDGGIYDACSKLASIYFAQGNRVEGERVLIKALQSGDPEDVYLLAQYYMEIKCYRKGRKYLSYLIREKADTIQAQKAYYLVGQYHLEKGKSTLARKYFQLAEAKTEDGESREEAEIIFESEDDTTEFDQELDEMVRDESFKTSTDAVSDEAGKVLIDNRLVTIN